MKQLQIYILIFFWMMRFGFSMSVRAHAEHTLIYFNCAEDCEKNNVSIFPVYAWVTTAPTAIK